MSEDDVREGMRVAVAEEPPFAFDPDAWISTAERQLRRRRALVAVGAATTAIAVAAVAVPVGLGLTGDGGDGYTAGAPPTVSSGPAATEPHRYTAAELSRRGEQMATVLLSRFPAVVPGASDLTVGEFGGEAEGSVADGQDYLNAFASFTLTGTRYAISVNTYAPDGNQDDPCADMPTQCKNLGLRDGGRIVLRTEDLEAAKILTLFHLRDNGSVVSIAGYNYDPASSTPPAYQPAVPLSVDQLVTLAVDKDLGL